MRIFSNDDFGDFAFNACLLAGFCGLFWLLAIFGPSIPRLAGQIGISVVIAGAVATLVEARVRATRWSKKNTKKV